tara:strand:- start:71 stop:1072 length:1002 start_codon:yes stop_codon:yes gene_type:complete
MLYKLYLLIIISLVILKCYKKKKLNEMFDNNLSIGLVTTTKSAHNLNDWINYHLDFGIKKIYLIFDDENENTSRYKWYDSRLSVIKNDNEWKEKLKACSQYNNFKDSYNTEVMTRQILNAEYVLKIAKVENIDWLIHIDVDEILYSKNHSNICSLFNNLNTSTNIIKIHNYEVAPTNDNTGNCFRSQYYFKTKKAGSMFNAYFNGKGGCKVNSDAYPHGVHDFKSKTEIKEIIDENDLVILHYVNCNFNEWVRKYKILGRFSDKWWGRKKIPLQFHTKSRDIINDNSIKFWENTCRQLYNKDVVLSESLLDNLVKDNKIIKIEDVNKRLNNFD